jgi:hypothetical protein
MHVVAAIGVPAEPPPLQRRHGDPDGVQGDLGEVEPDPVKVGSAQPTG